MLYLKFLSLFVLYFLPLLIAGYRGHDRQISILLLNFLLGWTGIGWVVALMWSLGNVDGQSNKKYP